jgi:hypothetical protein
MEPSPSSRLYVPLERIGRGTIDSLLPYGMPSIVPPMKSPILWRSSSVGDLSIVSRFAPRRWQRQSRGIIPLIRDILLHLLPRRHLAVRVGRWWRRGSLNGRSGAAGLRCWRDLPNDTPRSSAPLALRSGPLVKAAHPSAQKIPRDDNFLGSRAGPRWRWSVDRAWGVTPRASGSGGSAPPATLTRGRSGWSGPSTTS